MIDTRLKVRKERWRQSIFVAYEKKVLNYFLSQTIFTIFNKLFAIIILVGVSLPKQVCNFLS
jgi:uncharacterized Tic20 family protein